MNHKPETIERMREIFRALLREGELSEKEILDRFDGDKQYSYALATLREEGRVEQDKVVVNKDGSHRKAKGGGKYSTTDEGLEWYGVDEDEGKDVDEDEEKDEKKKGKKLDEEK